MSTIFSSYPLSKAAVVSLRPEPDTRYLTLNELRLQPLSRMLRSMRRIDDDALRVVVQEPSERAVMPLMLVLASLTRVRQVELHDLADSKVARIGRARAALGALGVVWASLSGLVTTWRLALLCAWLKRQPAQTHTALKSTKALYLKTNLMLGAKAGGSIGHIAGVANDLARRHSDTLVLAPEHPPLLNDGVRFEPIEPLQTYGVPAEVNHFRFNWRCVTQASKPLRRESFDFIYQRLTLGNLAGVLLSRRFGLPLVIEYNGSEVWVSQNWGHKLRHKSLAQSIEDVCLRHAHRVVTVSQVLADELLARGVPAERIVWYPNCIDPQMFDPRRYDDDRRQLRAQLGIADDELVVMFIGTFGLWHGAETLADAADALLSSTDQADLPRLRFVFVGDGLRLPVVRERLAAHIERGGVILTGLVPQHEAPRYLAAADIFSSPHTPPADGSKFFGSPTKLFEYMAMARPIVASRLDQLADVLQPAIEETALGTTHRLRADETALLTEPGSAPAIARAIEALRRDASLRRSLAAAARARALKHYTWTQHVDAIVTSLCSDR